MKTVVKIVSALVGILILIGLLPIGENTIISHALPAGMLAFAFLWIPIFLFYRYDSKQRIHEQELEKSEKESD